jgi:Flp pilus assembly protein TadD
VNYLDLRVRKENLAAQLATAGQPVEPQAITVVQTHTHENDLYASAPTPAQRIIALTNRIRKEGESVALLTELSGAFREVGDLGSAADMLARARALAPQDATTALNLALVHRARKDMSAARAAFADYLQLETNTDDLARVRSNPQFQSLLPE